MVEESLQPHTGRAGAAPACGDVNRAATAEDMLRLLRPATTRSSSVQRLLARRSRVQGVQTATHLDFVPASLHALSWQIFVALGSEPGQAHMFVQWGEAAPDAGGPMPCQLQLMGLGLARGGSRTQQILGLSRDGQLVVLAEQRRLFPDLSVWCQGDAEPMGRPPGTARTSAGFTGIGETSPAHMFPQPLAQDAVPLDPGALGRALSLVAGAHNVWSVVHERGIVLHQGTAGGAAAVVRRWPIPITSATGGARGLWTLGIDAMLSYWPEPLRPDPSTAQVPAYTLPLRVAKVPPAWAHSDGRVLACVHQEALHLFGPEGLWRSTAVPRGVGAAPCLT
ncbi:MAG: hypothetical protein EOO40_01820, partial [Deltaproteobacteria bacterium]